MFFFENSFFKLFYFLIRQQKEDKVARLEELKKNAPSDDIFDQLKAAVIDTAVAKHEWEDKAAEVLKVIQLNTLEDRYVCILISHF